MVLGFSIALIFSLIGLLHVYWAFGGRLGAEVAIPKIGGQKIFTPSPFATLIVAAALFSAAYVVLGKLNILSAIFPQWVFNAGIWFLAIVFLLRAIGDFRLVGFFKRIRNTSFAYLDTRFYTPLCLALSLGLFILTQL